MNGGNEPVGEKELREMASKGLRVGEFNWHHDWLESDTQSEVAPETTRRKKILNMPSRCKASARALIWPLVLYSLMQLFAQLAFPNDSSSCFQDAAKNTPSSSSSSSGSHSHDLRICSTNKEICSSNEISDSTQKPLLSAAHLSSLLQIFNQQRRSNNGAGVLLAHASSLYQPNEEKRIIILNSTNYNPELIQYKHPFPHIKLIEYYVTYCGFCAKFKATYNELAKQIYPWRNVIRPSALDIGISSNSPIARSWSIEIVPTLRIHPPPDPVLAEKLYSQLASLKSKRSQTELQEAMAGAYNNSRLMMQSLGALKYKDNESLLKLDLIRYIERYVRDRPSELPATWPNFRPVSETSLMELHRNHPRQELFLIIERAVGTFDPDQSSDDYRPSLGMSVMLELSSSASWKAIRFVRASENRVVIEDVIKHLKQTSEHRQNPEGSNVGEQVEFLENLLSTSKQSSESSIALVHIDYAHSSLDASGSTVLTFPFMTVVTGKEIMAMEQSIQIDSHFNNLVRLKRTADPALIRRSLLNGEASAFETMSRERKIELIALYIKQTYTETSEDRDFVRALNEFEELRIQQSQPNKTSISDQEQDAAQSQDNFSSMFSKIFNTLNPPDSKQNVAISSYSAPSDYDDKLKAIRYMFFNEIPRLSTLDKTLLEQQEKLNILVNLVTVIKTYFPFADSSSIQFIDEVQSYLIKQQFKLSSINSRGGNLGFDTRAFKRELKRLESENKRLPEIKEYKHCKDSGYPCALWRLFHTLTAFEYKKLSQIRQPALQSSSTGFKQSGKNPVPVLEVANLSGSQSPVERLVSPPSTTTSLSLTIASPTSAHALDTNSNKDNNINKPLTEADLPMPVLLVMRDYITTFFSCSDCAQNFRAEAGDLSLESIRKEPAEYSVLWLWEVHNRVNKRLSVDPKTNPSNHPKVWFPSYNQCAACYKKPPSYLHDTMVDSVTIFHESVEWNKPEILSFLLREYTSLPVYESSHIFGYQLPIGFGLIMVGCLSLLVLIAASRYVSDFVERQRRHKATLLNGNGNHTYELH